MCWGPLLPMVPQPRSSLDTATLTIWARIKLRRQGRVKSTASDTRQVCGQTGRSVGRAGAVRGGRWPGTGRAGAGAWHLCTTAELGLEAQSGGCRGSQGLVLSETLSCALSLHHCQAFRSKPCVFAAGASSTKVQMRRKCLSPCWGYWGGRWAEWRRALPRHGSPGAS